MMVRQRNPRVEVIRGVSILLVLFHHFNIAYRQSSANRPTDEAARWALILPSSRATDPRSRR